MAHREAVLVFALLGSVLALAQAPPSFDAASIRPNNSGARAGGVRALPGRIVATNATAKMLIQEAYDVRSYQVSGGPGWIESDRFDVEAKAGSGAQGGATQVGATEDELRPMLQGLLVPALDLPASAREA
jgi:uncharacterized protein (TIGR03435 family)